MLLDDVEMDKCVSFFSLHMVAVLVPSTSFIVSANDDRFGGLPTADPLRCLPADVPNGGGEEGGEMHPPLPLL